MSERKPWTEEWSLGSRVLGRETLVFCESQAASLMLETYAMTRFREEGEALMSARARLAAAAPAMARLLLELEWSARVAGFPACPSCEGVEPEVGSPWDDGHAVDCHLVAVLRLAGVRE